jgi:hypothetical protein
MAAEAAGWKEAIAGWQRELHAWQAPGTADTLTATRPSAELRARRLTDQTRRIDSFVRALVTHEAMLRMVLGAGSHPPLALATTAADDHRELKSQFDMLAASELSLESEHQELELPVAGGGGTSGDDAP